MDRVTSTVIDVVEAAYDVGPDDAAWFPTLLEVGDRLFEKGFGTGIRVVERPVDGGPIKNRELYTSPNMPSDWNETVLAMFQVLPPKFLEIRSRPGTAHTQSELWSIYQDERERLGYFGDYSDVGAMPGAEVIQKAVALGHKDALIVTAVDPYGVGFYFSLHLPEVTTLTEKERARWRCRSSPFSAAQSSGATRKPDGSSCPGSRKNSSPYAPICNRSARSMKKWWPTTASSRN